MDRLDLVQRLAIECGVSGTVDTTIGQTGENLRLVGWIDTAWQELQTKHDDWDWLRSSVLLGGGASFVTVAGQAYYPLGSGAGTSGVTAAALGKWEEGSFRCFPTATGFVGETFLDSIDFDAWRNAYAYGAQRSVQTRPVAIAVAPGKQLCLGPYPAVGYTIQGDFFRAPSAMAADADVPTGLPDQFHMLIVWDAMRMYAGYEAASEVYERGDEGYTKLLARLEMNYIPRATWAGALC